MAVFGVKQTMTYNADLLDLRASRHSEQHCMMSLIVSVPSVRRRDNDVRVCLRTYEGRELDIVVDVEKLLDVIYAGFQNSKVG